MRYAGVILGILSAGIMVLLIGIAVSMVGWVFRGEPSQVSTPPSESQSTVVPPPRPQTPREPDVDTVAEL